MKRRKSLVYIPDDEPEFWAWSELQRELRQPLKAAKGILHGLLITAGVLIMVGMALFYAKVSWRLQ